MMRGPATRRGPSSFPAVRNRTRSPGRPSHAGAPRAPGIRAPERRQMPRAGPQTRADRRDARPPSRPFGPGDRRALGGCEPRRRPGEQVDVARRSLQRRGVARGSRPVRCIPTRNRSAPAATQGVVAPGQERGPLDARPAGGVRTSEPRDQRKDLVLRAPLRRRPAAPVHHRTVCHSGRLSAALTCGPAKGHPVGAPPHRPSAESAEGRSARTDGAPSSPRRSRRPRGAAHIRDRW
jgi:hypothetical protein